MSDVTQDMIDCWRINYGLDKRTPVEAAKWWDANCQGFAPPGAVAALGVALNELDALRAEMERLNRALHDVCEEWAGAECGKPVHAQEAYAIGLAKRMYALAADALKDKT